MSEGSCTITSVVEDTAARPGKRLKLCWLSWKYRYGGLGGGLSR